MTKRFRLTKLDLDEVSLVGSGDDPMALQVLAKAAPTGSSLYTQGETCDCDTYTGTEDGKCERCGKPSKVMRVLKASPSFNELREGLREAYGEKNCHIEDFGADWVVFYHYGNYDGGGDTSKYLKMDYAITDGIITFGVPEEIERKTVWALKKSSIVPSGLDTSDFRYARLRKDGRRGRDGDGDGKYNEGRRKAMGQSGYKGKPVVPNPVGLGGKPNPNQDDIDNIIAEAESAARANDPNLPRRRAVGSRTRRAMARARQRPW